MPTKRAHGPEQHGHDGRLDATGTAPAQAVLVLADLLVVLRAGPLIFGDLLLGELLGGRTARGASGSSGRLHAAGTAALGSLGLASACKTAAGHRSSRVAEWLIREGSRHRKGQRPLEVAASIHSDIARGFIRCETILTDDLLDAGSHAEAAKRGTQRLEGKTYQVQDGDVLNIRFNV